MGDRDGTSDTSKLFDGLEANRGTAFPMRLSGVQRLIGALETAKLARFALVSSGQGIMDNRTEESVRAMQRSLKGMYSFLLE